jgi:hypothetical protein
MTLPQEHVARFGPGDNIPVYADPAAIEAARFVTISGKNAAGAYIAAHTGAAGRASGVSERRVPAVPTPGAKAPMRHSTNINRVGAVAFVEAGAAVVVGALIESDASGRAITRTGTNPVLGRALTAAAQAGDIIEVDRSVVA